MLTQDQSADYLRRYDGAPASILADGAWLLDRPAFWLTLVDGDAEPDLVTALFDVDDDAVDALDEELRGSGTWPVLRFGAGESDLALITWWGEEFEGGFDYVVLPAGSGRSLRVAGVEGHGDGPGLSWPEAERLVERGTLGTAEQRLLLLLPAIGDVETPESAVERVASALLAVGGSGADREIAVRAARQILDDQVRWTREGETLTCDGKHAVRSHGGLSPEDLLLVSRALA